MPTASDYVQNGLIGLWDGIENVGLGEHLDGNCPWVNLVSGETFKIAGSYFFDEDHLDMTSNATGVITSFASTPFHDAWSAAVDAREYTYEVVQGVYTSYGYESFAKSQVISLLAASYGFLIQTWGYKDNVIANANNSGIGNYWIQQVGPNGIGLGDHTLTYVAIPSGGYRVQSGAYIDGTMRKTAVLPNSSVADADITFSKIKPSSMRIGRSTTHLHSVDRIYAIRFYNRALSEAEIAYNRMLDRRRFGI